MKRGILLLVCLFAVGGCCVALRLATQEPPACPLDMRDETADKLEIGMAEQEFAAILGGPAGDYRTREDIGYCWAVCGFLWVPGPECVERAWLTDDRALRVWFGADAKAGKQKGVRLDFQLGNFKGVRNLYWYHNRHRAVRSTSV